VLYLLSYGLLCC